MNPPIRETQLATSTTTPAGRSSIDTTTTTTSLGGELGGTDFRPLTVADLTTYPWRCVGRLEAKPPGDSTHHHAGTATLIAPRMIVTASHCFRGRLFSEGWEFRFTPAYANGQQATDPTGGHHTRTGLTGNMLLGRPGHRGGTLSDRVAGWDFAICELAVPLGAYWGSLGVYSAPGHTYDDVRWTSIGYPTGLSKCEHPYLFPGIDIHGVEDDKNGTKEIETDDYVLRGPLDGGSFQDGWSGGPLMAVRGGIWVVAGVLSGTEPDGLDIDGTNVFAGGSQLVATHREAHNQWSRFDWSGWFPFGGAFPVVREDAGCCDGRGRWRESVR